MVTVAPFAINVATSSASVDADSLAVATIFRLAGLPDGPGCGSRMVSDRPRTTGGTSEVDVVVGVVDVVVVEFASTLVTKVPPPIVPAYRRPGSTASALTSRFVRPSFVGYQELPPSLVVKTPLSRVATKAVLGMTGSTTIELTASDVSPVLIPSHWPPPSTVL